MPNETIELKGLNGTMILDANSLTIKRGRSAWGLALKGDKTIPYTSIIAVQYKPSNFLISGFLQLTLKGGREAAQGTINAMSDENTIAFKGKENNQKFLEAKQYIEDKIINTPNNRQNSLEDLEKLAALKDKGIISDAEFDAKKKQLLGL